ncbi:hypothetical protein BDF20DRAFT_848005 [Mycotypha africana]|uniref:uncharacterized protein n=1 Tax=Mycotypha africana TaxID=64632 RepID=UPI0023001FFD|nr:uncharacterized protein BDF20DRAFT_848005 [Mycotypha africana]KAI8992062.1 hypothetical protein BDF20DRAFT_848005 [Mycotypha africana]
MRFFAAISGIALMISSVVGQLTAPMQNYNVTSPVANGPYVVGQVLPCTIVLFENIVSDISLSITLQSAAAGSNVSLPVATSVDTSKTPASAKQNGNVTYYEHSVNYNIPTTVTPGQYKVVFLDSKTNTHLDVPINVLPAASASVINSASATGGASASSTSSGSIFKSEGNSQLASTQHKVITSVAIFAAAALFCML